MTFSDFANAVCEIPDTDSDTHFKSQHTFITNSSGALIVDYVGELENLHHDFNYIKEVRKFPSHIELPHLLKSNSKKYESTSDKALFEKVGARYSTDISLFGY